MTPETTRLAYPVDQIRAAEEQLMVQVPEGALMQRAAAGLAVACADVLGERRGGVYGARVLVLAGSGHNGGDALYAGSRLAQRGARVEGLLLSPDRVHPRALAALRAAGGRVVDRVTATDLVLDGIVGIGGSAGLRTDAATAWGRVRDQRPRPLVVAVDVPSGVGADDGRIDGPHVEADVTVTFGAPKIGLLVGPGARAAGAVHVVDIGLGPHLPATGVAALTQPDVASLLAALAPGPADHKYTRGVVGVAAGSAEYPGAGLLCVQGASCGLAGMVRYAGPHEVADLIRTQRPEVVVGRGRVQAWVLGSGGGGDAAAVLAWARDDGVPLVVDADGLRHVTEPLGVPTLLTPHAGELARMLDVQRTDVESDPLRHARRAADRFAGVVLLKGDRTVVAAPGGETYVNTTGTPWLATAGAGDVLAGVAGALLAASGRPLESGAVAAWVHGAAATLAGSGGPVTATEVATAVPTLLRRLVA